MLGPGLARRGALLNPLPPPLPLHPASHPSQDHLAADPTSRAGGELLRSRLLAPGGAKEAHRMVEDLLGPASGGISRCGSGGFYPDPAAMLRQQGLLAG